MSSRSKGTLDPSAIVLAALFAVLALAICASAAKAEDFRTVLCAANNGSNSYGTTTNAGGVFGFYNACGPAPFPAGDKAFLRIEEDQGGGAVFQFASAGVFWDTPAFVHFREVSAYTRQPESFEEGWRERFVLSGGQVGTREIMLQGEGAPEPRTTVFASHPWPVGGYLDFTRFSVELQCVRQGGCDLSGANKADVNSMIFTLADESPAQVNLTNRSPLMEGRWVRGTQPILWHYSERGSGIRLETVSVDGSQRTTVDHAGQCNVDSNAAVGTFARSFQPCPTTEGFDNGYGLDTASLNDGVHTARVCVQDFAQWQGVNSAPSATCDQRPIYTDNTAPGAPVDLAVASSNPNRYLDHVGAQFSLPPNQGSPIAKVHYEIVNRAGEVVEPEQVVSATNLGSLTGIEAPARVGEYRLRVWLEDEVGLAGPAAFAPIPRDTTPPAAPQALSVTAPNKTREGDGFDARWVNIADAGSPIVAAHYQVIGGSGKIIVPTQTVEADGPTAIQELETPQAAGDYQLRLWLSDAEGNEGAPVTAPLAYECQRSRAPGVRELSAAVNGQAEATVAEGLGAVVSGSVKGRAEAVASASVCLFTRVETDVGQDFLGIALANGKGEYRFPIAAGPSREVVAVERDGHRQLQATAELHTVVGPSLRVRRPTVRNKGFAFFEGMVPGPHSDEVVVVLQVKDGKHWRVFRRFQTRNGGRYALRYRFTQTRTPTTYVMRAEVPRQSGYPFETGVSPVVRLHVKP